MEDGRKVNTDADEKVVEENDGAATQHQLGIAILLNRDRVGEKLTCDLTLTSGGKEFQVHKNVMMLTCAYFKKMLTVEMTEKYSNVISMKKIPPNRLSDLISFIYTGKVVITEENVLNFVDDAEFLQLQTLKTRCTNFLLQAISVDNCIKFQAYAERYNLVPVLEKCNFILKNNFAGVVHSDEFLQLGFSDLSAVMKKRSRVLYAEEAAFEGIVKWVNFDVCSRKNMFFELFSSLDFSLMTPEFLKIVANELLVKEDLKCTNLFIAGFLKAQAIPSNDSFLLIGGIGKNKRCVAYNIITRKSKKLPDLQTGRIGATAVKVKNKVYVMGGANSEAGGTTYKTCEVLDTAQPDKWEEIPDMTKTRKWPSSTYAKGHIYVTGGWRANLLSECERYNIVDRTWEGVAELPRPKCGHGFEVCQDLLYSVEGLDSRSITLNSCESYDMDENKWVDVAPLNQARSWCSCVELGGKIYVIGGNEHGNEKLKTVERYTPETDTWEYVASLKVPRWRSSACVLGGRIYVIGGKNNNRALKSVEVYDPTADEWTLCFDVDEPVHAACAVSL